MNEKSIRDALKNVALLWQVRLKNICPDLLIEGSPERSLFRVVIEDGNGSFYVLERIAEKSLEHKKRIAAALESLAKNNLALIRPYLVSAEGEHVVRYKNDFWQMAPFVQGVKLDRGKYMDEQWRGAALAAFLIELRRKSENMFLKNPGGVFSLPDYIHKLIREIHLYNHDIKDVIGDVAGFLEKDFLRVYAKLPVVFCHGDYHPLNVIWADTDIQCVIDWEFCGYKSELYDTANLVGCVGSEDPQCLTGGLIESFLADMKGGGLISEASWEYLVEFIVAVRFAWLSEWLRRKDAEMIALELDYMRLLMDNREVLRRRWRG